MTRAADAAAAAPDAAAGPSTAVPLAYAPPPAWTTRSLAAALLRLFGPVLAENLLHMGVGLTDVYLAGNLKAHAAAATAAVGVVGYVLWLVGLITGAIGTGSTAIIARAVGARNRRLANSVCGQSIGAAALTGAVIAAVFYVAAGPLTRLTGLSDEAAGYTLYYFRILSLSLPFSMVMLAAGACLRGAGDTLSPAAAMIVVDVVNMGTSAALARGWLGLPMMGFRGIAVGTVLAYVVGGVLLFALLLRGRRSLRLYWHRLRPHWRTLRRVMAVGLPNGIGDTLAWAAQFVIVLFITRLGPDNVPAAAHILAVRVESLSYLAGYAMAVAAATMVGQSLGMKDARRATVCAYLAFALAAAFMGCMGGVFIAWGRPLAGFFNADPATVDLAARCLYVTAFAQVGFAAAMVFSGVLRGAGDTVALMGLNLASTVCLRFAGVVVALFVLHLGLVAVWVVLAGELAVRGALFYGRFLQGKWRHVRV